MLRMPGMGEIEAVTSLEPDVRDVVAESRPPAGGPVSDLRIEIDGDAHVDHGSVALDLARLVAEFVVRAEAVEPAGEGGALPGPGQAKPGPC
jgi:hypothetical protein